VGSVCVCGVVGVVVVGVVFYSYCKCVNIKMGKHHYCLYQCFLIDVKRACARYS
jgi:hypothetical protein